MYITSDKTVIIHFLFFHNDKYKKKDSLSIHLNVDQFGIHY